MANVQVAGFQPISKGGLTVEMQRVTVITNNTTAIFKGDAVVTTASGDWIVASATNTAVGSVQWGGASYMSGSQRLERRHLPAATLYTSTTVDPANASYIYVVNDPVTTEFKASVDEALTLTDLGLNYVMVLGAGSTTSGLSKHELDATSRAATASFPWLVKNFVLGDPKSDVDLADAAVICKINAGLREPALDVLAGL